MIETPKTIIVDVDDCLCFCGKNMLNYINKQYGLDLQFDDITDWNAVPRYMAEKLQISFEKANALYQATYDQEWFFASLEPIEGAIDGLSKLRSMGFGISIATKAPWTSLYATKEKYDWVQKHWPGNDFKFYITGNKEGIRGEFLIDDAPHNLAPAKEAGIKTICMNKPWNKDSSNDVFIHHRVDTWEDIIEYFSKYSFEKIPIDSLLDETLRRAPAKQFTDESGNVRICQLEKFYSSSLEELKEFLTMYKYEFLAASGGQSMLYFSAVKQQEHFLFVNQ